MGIVTRTSHQLEKQGKHTAMKTYTTGYISKLAQPTSEIYGINSEFSVAKNTIKSWPEFCRCDCRSFFADISGKSLQCVFFSLLLHWLVHVIHVHAFRLGLDKNVILKDAWAFVYECIQSRPQEYDYALYKIFRTVRWCIYALVIADSGNGSSSWWRHQMEAFSALLAICAGNSPVPGEFPAQRPVTRSFDVFFDLRLNKQLSKQSWGWWFETPPHPLWRHSNVC